MSLTMEELIERLEDRWDVEEVCERLQLTTRDVLERFDDKLADLYDEITEEIDDGG